MSFKIRRTGGNLNPICIFGYPTADETELSTEEFEIAMKTEFETDDLEYAQSYQQEMEEAWGHEFTYTVIEV